MRVYELLHGRGNLLPSMADLVMLLATTGSHAKPGLREVGEAASCHGESDGVVSRPGLGRWRVVEVAVRRETTYCHQPNRRT